MKKLYVFLLAVLSLAMFMPGCSSTNSMGNPNQNMANIKLKELKKAGWEVYGTTKTLEMVLMEFYQKLESEDAIEVVGEATSTSKQLGSTSALQAAQSKYAQSASSYLEGRVESDLSNELKDGDMKELQKLLASYKTQLGKEMNGQVKAGFYLARRVGKNSQGRDIYEVQCYCIVDESAASLARQRALVMSARENDLASKYGTRLSDYVKESVRMID